MTDVTFDTLLLTLELSKSIKVDLDFPTITLHARKTLRRHAGIAARETQAELQQLIAGMQSDFEKFYLDGNKAAGTRVRNGMQELETLAQAIRTEVQAIKNEGKGGDDAQPD